MKTVWVTGWGLDEFATRERLRAWDPADHHVVLPGPNWQDELVPLLERDTWLCGYSVGAFLLLGAPELLARVRGGILFAPFLDIKDPGDSKKTDALLERWEARLRDGDRRPVAAFFRWAQVDQASLPEVPLDTLVWGLKTLRRSARQAQAAAGFRCWIGEHDPLVDVSRIKEQIPHVQIIPGANHELATLLPRGCPLQQATDSFAPQAEVADAV